MNFPAGTRVVHIVKVRRKVRHGVVTGMLSDHPAQRDVRVVRWDNETFSTASKTWELRVA